MPRPRIRLAGIPQHILQRINGVKVSYCDSKCEGAKEFTEAYMEHGNE